MNNFENNEILNQSLPISPIRNIQYEYYYDDVELAQLINNLCKAFEIPITSDQANIASLVSYQILSLFNDPEFMNMMNNILDRLIEFGGIILQDIYNTNKQIGGSFEDSINCDIQTIDNMVNRINSIINYYKLAKGKFDHIQGRLNCITERCQTFYRNVVNCTINMFDVNINTIKNFAVKAKNYNYNAIPQNIYNKESVKLIMSKIHKGWEINKTIYNKLIENLHSTFGTYYNDTINITNICKDNIHLTLSGLKSPIEMFSIISFIDNQLMTINLADSLVKLQNYKKFLNM
jgi:hypothetical protein